MEEFTEPYNRGVNWLRSFVAACFLVSAFLSGCGGNGDEAKVIGDWVGSFHQDNGKVLPGANINIDKDHRFREVYGNLIVEGSWSVSATTLTLKTEKMNGKTVAEAKQTMLAHAAKSRNPEALKSMAENLDKPITMTLSGDGKKITTPVDPKVHGNTEYQKQ